MEALGQRDTTHFVFATRTSTCTRFQRYSSYSFIFSVGTSESSETLALPRIPM